MLPSQEVVALIVHFHVVYASIPLHLWNAETYIGHVHLLENNGESRAAKIWPMAFIMKNGLANVLGSEYFLIVEREDERVAISSINPSVRNTLPADRGVAPADSSCRCLHNDYCRALLVTMSMEVACEPAIFRCIVDQREFCVVRVPSDVVVDERGVPGPVGVNWVLGRIRVLRSKSRRGC